MIDLSKNTEIAEYFLKPGYIYFTSEPTVISSVLGSCVAITIYDRSNCVGGMNHFAFSNLEDGASPNALYAKPATFHLIRLFSRAGSDISTLEAQIFGGGMPEDYDSSAPDIGGDNLKAAMGMLDFFGIKLVGSDIGGHYGRKVVFNSSTGEVFIAKVNRIRQSDWFPFPEI